MGEVPLKPRTRRGRRNLAGSLRGGLHTVTIEMRKPSRYVPLMIAVGIGAFVSFGWPLVAKTQDPHLHLDTATLGQLVAVHRGSADRSGLDEFTRVKALVRFEALPASDEGRPQGSLVVLREVRVVSDQVIAAVLDQGDVYKTTIGGVGVQVRSDRGALQILIGAAAWPVIQLPGAK